MGMTLKSDIIAKATAAKALQDDIIALANQIQEGSNPPTSGLIARDCLPTWSSTGAFSGYNLASISATPAIPDNNSANLTTYDATCNAAPDGSIVCIGDSITQRNTFSNIAADCTAAGKQLVNLGYSGEMARRLMYRLNSHPAHRNLMKRASAVVINTGVNDLGYYFDNFPPEVGVSGAHNAYQMVEIHYKDLAACMGGKWVVMGVLPINEPAATASVASTTGRNYAGYNADITQMNVRINAALQSKINSGIVAFIDPIVDMPTLFDANGNLKDEHDDNNDSIHPNSNCYATIINPCIRSKLVTLGVLS